jgi:hypothetical protein
MQSTIVRVFVSSTWIDLKPERERVEEVLDRFKDTKFIGMERFGSHPETTRVESLREIDQCDLYLGIIGGRYGSGITEAEYDRAREKGLPCFVYFKQEQQVRPEDHDEEAERTELLVKFKAKLKDPSSGHTVAEFSGPYELASIAASDLHNWLVEKFLAPAIREATGGQTGAEPLHSLERGLRELAAINPDLQRKAATERSKAEALRRLALEAFYPLTYEVPKILAQFPGTEGQREQFIRKNLTSLDSLYEISDGAPEVLRELTTNYRILGEALVGRREWRQAYAAYKDSARRSEALVKLEPDNALYHRDLAVSYSNAGSMLEQLEDATGARIEYERSLPSARRAAELDRRWTNLPTEMEDGLRRLK